MRNFAIGEIGMLPKDFYYGMTWADFQIKVHFYIQNQNKDYRTSWEQTRALAQIIVSTSGSKTNLNNAWEFPWEKESNRRKWKRAQLTQAEVNNLIKTYSKHLS